MHAHPAADRLLDLEQLLPGLIAQGLIAQPLADQVLTRYRTSSLDPVHPLVFLAAQQLPDLTRPGKTLTLEHLTAWLAQQ